jgi:hypothetical protein
VSRSRYARRPRALLPFLALIAGACEAGSTAPEPAGGSVEAPPPPPPGRSRADAGRTGRRGGNPLAQDAHGRRRRRCDRKSGGRSGARGGADAEHGRDVHRRDRRAPATRDAVQRPRSAAAKLRSRWFSGVSARERPSPPRSIAVRIERSHDLLEVQLLLLFPRSRSRRCASSTCRWHSLESSCGVSSRLRLDRSATRARDRVPPLVESRVLRRSLAAHAPRRTSGTRDPPNPFPWTWPRRTGAYRATTMQQALEPARSLLVQGAAPLRVRTGEPAPPPARDQPA